MTYSKLYWIWIKKWLFLIYIIDSLSNIVLYIQHLSARPSPSEEIDLEWNSPSICSPSSALPEIPATKSTSTVSRLTVTEHPNMINTTQRYSQVFAQGLSKSGLICDPLNGNECIQDLSSDEGSYIIGNYNVEYTFIGAENILLGCGGCCPQTDCPSCQASPEIYLGYI